VLNYTIFQVCQEGNGTTELILETMPEEGNISMSGYNLCTDTLRFYAIPYSTLGQGQRSNIVVHEPLNLTGRCNDILM
jgi:hypothetical protein